MKLFKTFALIMIVSVIGGCTAPTAAPTLTVIPTTTALSLPSSMPSPTATFALLPTHYPTATLSLALSTAVANGECINSFDSFAYHGPGKRPETFTWQPPPWKIEATVPPHGVDGYNDYPWGLTAALTRWVGGRQEVWLTGRLYPDNYTGKSKSVLYVYEPETRQWEVIPGDVGDTDLLVWGFFVTKDGAVWGQTIWDSVPGHSSPDNVPVLSKFNETTRRFELAQGVLEFPLVSGEQYYNWPKIVLDTQDTFWIFADNDGIYHYDPATQTTDKRADLLDSEIADTALSPDGSIYFAKHSDRMYSGKTFLRTVPGTLFQFVPETREIVSIDLPDEEWPAYSGLLTDHTGKLWLGSIGYRNPDGDWHLIDPHVDQWFQLVDEGGYSYVWATPWPMLESSDGILWYQKSLDTSGWVDGVAWYDPNTGEGCQITNIPTEVIEDSAHRLWLAAEGKLYQYPLN